MGFVICARSSWRARSACCRCSWPEPWKPSVRQTRPRSSRSPASSLPSSCPAGPSRSSLLGWTVGAYSDREMRGGVRGPGASNLPAELTSFVGRRQELREVKHLLTTTRLLTLTGTGGAGKTRLAIRAAAEMARGFPDGVCIVQLAPVQDPMLVTQAVFDALDVRDLSARLSLSALSNFLAAKRLLLILDNCEHLLDSCAILVGSLLASCPNLQILVTSRQALGMPAEHRMHVPPLSLPVEGAETSVEGLANAEAVWLLTERASAVVPGFKVDADNAAA